MASEACTIRILFPVESDEQAIAIKQKIGEVISDIPDANMQFSLTTMPLPPKQNA